LPSDNISRESLPSGGSHVLSLRLPQLSIAFVSDTPPDQDFPVYKLESTDGSYSQELSPKNDLETIKGQPQIRFRELDPQLNYTLTVTHAPELTETVFADRPYAEITDQDRPHLQALPENAFAEMDFDLESPASFEIWEDEG